jgi:hypothetical protein
MSSPTLVFAVPESYLRRPFVCPLRAGPVTLEFVDGDLRHLRAGGEELIRRITFNVRHHKWDTADWRVDSFRLEQQPDSFFLHFSAACEIAGAGYKWEADLTGEADGTINYGVRGVAHADSTEVRRAGLNILYANECVLGQPFETTHLDGKVVTHTFPELVPAHHLPAMDFTKISHRTRGGAFVTAEITGSQFGLEDQRVAGDSSFKAFSGLRHIYAPVLVKGDRAEKKLTLSFSGLAANAAEPKATAVAFHGKSHGNLPQLAPARPQETYGVFHELTRRPAAKNGIFLDVNLAKEKCRDAAALTWGWYPTVNLSDDEIVMDNASSIAGQLRSTRRLAPGARLRIDPIALDSLHPRATPRDPRNDTPFAAAWLVAAAKHLALGGTHEAAFVLDGPFARAALAALAHHSGCAFRDATVTCAAGSAPVAAFALETDSGLALWLANLTAETQPLTLSALPPTAPVTLQRLHAATGHAFREFPGGFTDAHGQTSLRLAPHEVCQLNLDRTP